MNTTFGQPLQIKICLRNKENERTSKRNQSVGSRYTVNPGQEVTAVIVTGNTGAV